MTEPTPDEVAADMMADLGPDPSRRTKMERLRRALGRAAPYVGFLLLLRLLPPGPTIDTAGFLEVIAFGLAVAIGYDDGWCDGTNDTDRYMAKAMEKLVAMVRTRLGDPR